ncbi:MAG: hypothetical protein OSA97_08020 [Nevskia sp.]|nr:hypothetical protein [Nevskia sp.]
MKRACSFALLVLACAAAGAAQAFTISAKSENPLVTEDALRGATQQVAAEIGNRIPDDPNVKVTVFTRAVPAKQGQGRYVYLHRIELRRAFNAGPPYPYAGWLPIQAQEQYGVGSEAEMRAKLDEALRAFFTALKPVDPNVGFK